MKSEKKISMKRNESKYQHGNIEKPMKERRKRRESGNISIET